MTMTALWFLFGAATLGIVSGGWGSYTGEQRGKRLANGSKETVGIEPFGCLQIILLIVWGVLAVALVVTHIT
jgi:hypothetical protein